MSASSASSARLLARTKGREKPQLSCDFCRKRKLRCDRKKPCESCIRLGQASTCRFPFPQLSHAHSSTAIDRSNQGALQERIVQLESLVRSTLEKLQDKTAPSTPSSTHYSDDTAVSKDGEPLAGHFGRMKLQQHESSYVESNHWTAILDEISDLKDMVTEQTEVPHSENPGQSQMLPGVDLFLLQTYPTSKLEIIAALPPRLVVDSIIAKYFKSADMPVALVIHRRVFFKQYEKFWEDPLSTPIIWVTILFGMMYIVASFTLLINGGLDSLDEETLGEYRNIIMVSREKMIHCLRLGNYMKGTPHTIEALLAFAQVEFTQGEDTQQGCWQLMGVIIRIALKMGYHRDGSHFPEMSVYEAEMRRRTWYILMQFDIASASQVGLPRIIKQTQCDTAEPHNLLDDDFDDTTMALPPSRPQTEHTLSQFLIYKSRIVSIYGMICDFTTSSKQRNYDEAMGLDRMLNAAYSQKPSILELKPMHRSILDGTELITRRLYLALSFHHAQMTLHRKFMILAKTNIKYAFSHTTCVDAALAVLGFQADLYEQCQPGRLLYADRWKILLLIQSEFLLATTILCFNLDDDLTNARLQKSSQFLDAVYRKSVTALQSSRAVWKQQEGFSKEAQTAVKAIDVVLSKAQSRAEIPTPKVVPGSQVETPSFWPSSTASSLGAGSDIPRGGDIAPTLSGPGSDGVASQSYSNSNFDPDESQSISSVGLLSNTQINPIDGGYGEFFDMDWSWDMWLQLNEYPNM